MKSPNAITAFLVCLVAGAAFALLSAHAEDVNPSQRPLLTKGMPLETSLALLREQGVDAKEAFRAVIAADDNQRLREFAIVPAFRKSDTIFLEFMAPVARDEFKLVGFTWHVDWDRDSVLPYTKRRNIVFQLEYLDAGLLRLEPYPESARKSAEIEETNPFE